MDTDSLRPARGIAWGSFFGGIAWAVIVMLWIAAVALNAWIGTS